MKKSWYNCLCFLLGCTASEQTGKVLDNLSFNSAILGDQKHTVRFYIDCGDDDFLYQRNASLHTLMRDKQIPHAYRVRNGGHTREYRRTALPEVLKFV